LFDPGKKVSRHIIDQMLGAECWVSELLVSEYRDSEYRIGAGPASGGALPRSFRLIVWEQAAPQPKTGGR
jgi:hypothetical protein